MKTVWKILLTVYWLSGAVIAFNHYDTLSTTFECRSSDTPHGYVTIWSEHGTNPNPGQCMSQADKYGYLKDIAALTIFGVPLLFMKMIA